MASYQAPGYQYEEDPASPYGPPPNFASLPGYQLPPYAQPPLPPAPGPALPPPPGSPPGSIVSGSSTVFGQQPNWQDLILNDPRYKQELEWQGEDFTTARGRAERDRQFAQQAYGLNLAQLQQSGAASAAAAGAGAEQEAALDAMRREQAAHDYENRKEQLREIMASRGMVDSGQMGWEKDEALYQFNNFMKELTLAAQSRAAQRAASAAASSAGLGLRMQELELQHKQRMTEFDDYLEDLTRKKSRDAGGLLFETYDRLLADPTLQPQATEKQFSYQLRP